MQPVTSSNARRPRAVLYLRQSTYREESISLELQETAGRDYCERQGYDVVAVEADPGISGRTWNRPAVQRVLGMVEVGSADVIVLWKWSRLSRSRRDWAIAADKVDVAGGRIESATEPIDVATSAGRFARGVMTELAAFESERIGDGWREAHARRVAAGLPATGKPRWGYAYDREAKIHRPDPTTGPVLADLYRRYLAGESVYALVRWLNNEGHRTSAGYGPNGGGGLWSDRSLRRVLDSGFAAGLITVDGEQRPGAHEPVISADTWDAYRVARGNRRVQRGSERSQYLLSGLIRCACGSPMNAGQFGHARVSKYRCRDARNKGTHDGGYITARYAEDEVLAWVRDLAASVDQAASAGLDELAARRARRDPLGEVVRQRQALETRLVRLTRQHLEDVIPEGPYVELRDEITQQIDALAARELEAKVAASRAPAPEMARQLAVDWDVLGVENRRAMLRQMIACVVVTPGRPRGAVEVVPLWSDHTVGVHGDV